MTKSPNPRWVPQATESMGFRLGACARIAAWYTSSFTIGASLSFLFGRVGTLLGWRSAFVIAGILGTVGVLIA